MKHEEQLKRYSNRFGKYTDKLRLPYNIPIFLMPGEVYVFSEPRFVGVMPMRKEINLIPDNNYKVKASLGWLLETSKIFI